MAGFSHSIQTRYMTPWIPVQQQGRGKPVSKKRHPEKAEIKYESKSKRSHRQEME